MQNNRHSTIHHSIDARQILRLLFQEPVNNPRNVFEAHACLDCHKPLTVVFPNPYVCSAACLPVVSLKLAGLRAFMMVYSFLARVHPLRLAHIFVVKVEKTRTNSSLKESMANISLNVNH